MIRLLLCLLFTSIYSILSAQKDYTVYHQKIIQIEQLSVDGKFHEALVQLESLFQTYDFVFLRDIKVAAQLAMLIKKEEKALKFIKRGIAKGWTPKSISKNKLLAPITKNLHWESIKSNYSSDPEHLEINYRLRTQVQIMFKKDQKKAFGAMRRVGNKAQEKYGSEKLAPHSEQQIAELNQLLEKYGYPGEMLIANDFWASTILSHHNSISEEYVKHDTLFKFIAPKLMKAVEDGQMSPFEFALISDWKTAVETNHASTTYGFVGAIKELNSIEKINSSRANIGLRSIKLRNRLVDLEQKSDLDFYLPGKPWQKGKIQLVQ